MCYYTQECAAYSTHKSVLRTLHTRVCCVLYTPECAAYSTHQSVLRTHTPECAVYSTHQCAVYSTHQSVLYTLHTCSLCRTSGGRGVCDLHSWNGYDILSDHPETPAINIIFIYFISLSYEIIWL